jgi:hypothetical protein
MAPSSISAAASPVVDGLENRFQVAPAQAVGKNGIMGEGPNKGYYVSATSLRFNNEMHKTTNFLDAEEIPYVVLPLSFPSARPGDLGSRGPRSSEPLQVFPLFSR